MAPPQEQVVPVFPKCAVIERGPVVTVALDGELDCATAPVVGAELQAIVDTGAARISIDLRNITFLGMAGLHVLDDIGRHLALSGGRLDVLCRDVDRRLFAITEVDRTIHVRSDLDPVLTQI